MSRRKVPLRTEGVLLAEHRNGRGRIVAETRVHFDEHGVCILRWEDGGGRIPEEWTRLDHGAAEKLQAALRQNIDQRAAAAHHEGKRP